MPRQPRIQYPGAIYHLESIFVDDEDREIFLRTMNEAVEDSRRKVYGWILMTNHYYWTFRTPEPKLVAGMR